MMEKTGHLAFGRCAASHIIRKGEDSMTVNQEGNKILIHYGVNDLTIEAWGKDGIRVQMNAEPVPDLRDWALSEPVPEIIPEITSEEVDMTDPWYRSEEWAR